MEGLTPEQAAVAAQWGPNIGPPGPVSYILHVLMSQDDESSNDAANNAANNPATGNGADQQASEAPVANQPTSTTTFDSVSNSATASSWSETSASTTSTTSETTSSAASSTSDVSSISQDTFSSSTSDPTTTTNDWPRFSLSITTTSSVSTPVPTSSAESFSYDPIGGSISFAPTTSSSSSSSTEISTSTTSPTLTGDLGADATETASSDMVHMSNARKQAIVGGLAGAIGALVLVGLLLCFCLRRRHRRDDEEEDEEDGLKKPEKVQKDLRKAPSTIRLWSDMALGRSPARSTPEISRPRTPSPVDGSLIRVSTEHWTRPFVRKEGLRESLEPAPLRVVNGGSSRSSTPQEERQNGFIRKQRSALAAFLQDGPRTNSRNAVRRGPISYPKPMAGDPKYSSKATVDSGAETPRSMNSMPSDTSSPMVVQKPPEDPFFQSTPMLSTMEEVAPPMGMRKSPVERTVSHFGKNANPFRTQVVPSVALPPRIFSYSNPDMRASTIRPLNVRRSSIGSTYSQKTRRDTAATMPRVSDQFDLMISPDQMPPASGILAKAAEYEEREKEKKATKKQQEQQKKEETPSLDSSPNWKLYEGT